MKIGFIGLGKMGYNLVLNLLDHKHKVVVYNRSPEKTREIAKKGALSSFSIEEFIKKLPKQKIIWVMLPAGSPVTGAITKLFPYLSKGDIIIDGGNSFYKDSINRAKKLNNYGINFIDIGVSGGPSGARSRACLMVGGTKNNYNKLLPLLKDISVDQGVEFFEGYGAGHFVKMIHNGIEYGMMQSIAEGFAIIEKSNYKLDLKKVAGVYNHGSVIESRLIGWMKNSFENFGNELKNISGSAQESGEGRWTVETARELKVKTKVLKESVKAREKSKKKPSYQGKIITALRNQFGGHDIK